MNYSSKTKLLSSLQFELAVITDMIKTPLIKQDEFSIFSQAINTMATQRADITQILSLLTTQ